MDRKKYLIVMAAGHGSRMGSGLPKQFLSLGGKAILRMTMMKFMEACPDINIITVLPIEEEYFQWWKTYCIENNFTCPQILVKGGITRFHSVKAALEKVPDGALVAVHDGVRPLVSSGLVRSMFKRMEEDKEIKALIPVLPVVDTLKCLKKERKEDGKQALSLIPGAVVDRSVIYGAQTPQIFCSEDIKAAYSQAYDVLFTDDASVASAYEIPLTFCEGERLNFKITTPEDLLLAEAVLSLKG